MIHNADGSFSFEEPYKAQGIEIDAYKDKLHFPLFDHYKHCFDSQEEWDKFIKELRKQWG